MTATAEHLPGGGATAAAGKFSVKLESVTAHAMSTAAVKLSDELTVGSIPSAASSVEMNSLT